MNTQSSTRKQRMNIFKFSLFTLIAFFTLSTKLLATESSSSWFAGSAVTIGEFTPDDGGTQSAYGVELHGGYQFGKYLKLIVGVNTFHVKNGNNVRRTLNSISTMFFEIRPQWEFDNGFLVYFDVGASGGFKFGLGLGYNQGQHEVTVGLDSESLVNRYHVGGVVIGYSYHF